MNLKEAIDIIIRLDNTKDQRISYVNSEDGEYYPALDAMEPLSEEATIKYAEQLQRLRAFL
jgi:hypothetical protein